MAAGPNPMPDFSDFAKMLADWKLPSPPNMDAFVAASQRNMETIAAANRVALEGAQAVAKRHAEIMRQGMADMAEAARAMTPAGDPQAQAALLKQAYEGAVANLREIGELIQRSNAEATALLQQRFAEAMEEVKALSGKA